jgi:hypothetical protein
MALPENLQRRRKSQLGFMIATTSSIFVLFALGLAFLNVRLGRLLRSPEHHRAVLHQGWRLNIRRLVPLH